MFALTWSEPYRSNVNPMLVGYVASSAPASTRVPVVEMSTNEKGTSSVAVYPKESGPIVVERAGKARPSRIASSAPRAAEDRRLLHPQAPYMGLSSVQPG